MPTFYSDLSLSAQTAYAQTMDHAMMSMVHRSVADIVGTFAKKTVAGSEYWYYQYRDVDSVVKQIYLGPRNDRLDRLIAQKNTVPKQNEAITRQARSAIALGNSSIPRTQFKVIRRLEEYGFFKAGGILIGTHAFVSYANMLGIRWADSNKTLDVDFAYSGKSISLALPTNITLDVHDAITSLEMGFLPASKLDGLVGGSYIIPHDPDFRLDFITPIGRDQVDLINFPNLNVAMTPLKFMEYSLEDIHQAALLSEDGVVLVNVPSPARFSLHKLIVAGERAGSFATKSNKDLKQSAALITYLSEHQPARLAEAWHDLEGRGKGWRSRFQIGKSMLVKQFPELSHVLQEIADTCKNCHANPCICDKADEVTKVRRTKRSKGTT